MSILSKRSIFAEQPNQQEQSDQAEQAKLEEIKADVNGLKIALKELWKGIDDIVNMFRPPFASSDLEHLVKDNFIYGETIEIATGSIDKVIGLSKTASTALNKLKRTYSIIHSTAGSIKFKPKAPGPDIINTIQKSWLKNLDQRANWIYKIEEALVPIQEAFSSEKQGDPTTIVHLDACATMLAKIPFDQCIKFLNDISELMQNMKKKWVFLFRPMTKEEQKQAETERANTAGE